MSAPSIHADPPPELVSDPEGLQYATGSQLGKGGFAICHRAKLMGHEHLGNTTVALKIVKSRMEPAKLAQKFVTELQIHSKLAHPNIVEFYRAFSFELNTYVVLELCENGSLADAIKRRKYFTMPEIRRFMIQTCGAIKYLHQRNIVHRDLKTGNLFLDKDMNVKVGDFGLAALLVSQSDYGAIRRTTMCGTPNYLAPEVLEKTGKGHDEKVDLWAIGIMMYTLAVGRAPFHAAKREDIYRKLKAREYSWPDLAKCPNEITDDLRDVVSLLLVHEDERPTPDQIVAHPFFRLGAIPLQLDSTCTQRVPVWKTRPPSASAIKRGFTEEWWTMCKASAVGEYEPGKTFGAYGSRRNKTVARDCQKEIESGKQPSIPFAKDIVYLPFPERVYWPCQSANGLSEITEEKESSSEGQALLPISGNDRRNERIPRSGMKENLKPPVSEDSRKKTEALVKAGSLTDLTADKQPTRLRPVRKISNPGRVTAATIPSSVPLRLPRETRSMQRTRTKRDLSSESAEHATEAPSLRVQKSTSRIVRKPDVPGTQSATFSAEAVQHRTASSGSVLQLRVVSSELPATDPVAVLARLCAFHDNLTCALDKRPSNSRRDRPPYLPFVSKWVDYSRKHGVGYVLDDGSVGCVTAATNDYPVTVAFAADGLHHLNLVQKNTAHRAKVPMRYYSALDKSKGFSQVQLLDDKRDAHIRTLWHKFGRYMCNQLGDADWPRDGSEQMSFVKFYQRLGNVGIWSFEDGSFQFNFPDHTKLVLSSDAGYGKLICLTKEATAVLKATGELPWSEIRSRETLCGSLQQLLYGSIDKEDGYRVLTERNELRAKLEIVQRVVSDWISGGGLGCLPSLKGYEWNGAQIASDRKRMDYASVGRFGGDRFDTA